MGPDKFRLAFGYINGYDQEQKEASDVFHAGTPGALSLDKLEEKIDLGQWRLKLGQRLVKLEVNMRALLLRLLLMYCTESSWLG